MTTINPNTHLVLKTVTTRWKSLAELAVECGLDPHTTYCELKKLEKLGTVTSHWEDTTKVSQLASVMYWRIDR